MLDTPTSNETLWLVLPTAGDATKARLLTIRDADAMLMINAGEIRKCGADRKRALRVLHQPTSVKKDYAGRYGGPAGGASDVQKSLGRVSGCPRADILDRQLLGDRSYGGDVMRLSTGRQPPKSHLGAFQARNCNRANS
jgi:hypothetical protein